MGPGLEAGVYHFDAQALGLRTAFIARPTEYGPGQAGDLRPEGKWDFSMLGVDELAGRLGA